jgi:hypothetical protein
VVATDTQVLFEALAGVYSSLGFDALGDEVFRDLVIARIVEPTSVLDSARVLTDLGRRPASYATMRRTLARARATPAEPADPARPSPGSYRDRIATLCFEHALTSGDISMVLYDVTTQPHERGHPAQVIQAGLPVAGAGDRPWMMRSSRAYRRRDLRRRPYWSVRSVGIWRRAAASPSCWIGA